MTNVEGIDAIAIRFSGAPHDQRIVYYETCGTGLFKNLTVVTGIEEDGFAVRDKVFLYHALSLTWMDQRPNRQPGKHGTGFSQVVCGHETAMRASCDFVQGIDRSGMMGMMPESRSNQHRSIENRSN